MKKRHLLASCLLALFWVSNLEAGTLRFAPLPMQDPERVVSDVYPMLQYLEAETGLRFQLVYTESYQELLQAMAAGEVDLTYLGPLPYVELAQRYADISPLVVFREPDGQASYTCALVTFAGAPLPASSWQQQVFALTQPMSTCGYLATSYLLQQRGVDLQEAGHCYVNRHDEVALSVVRGEFAAGGMKTQIARNYQHLGLVVEAETPAFPGFSLVANTQTLSETQQDALRQALLALQPLQNPAAAALVATWGENFRYGAAQVNPADFDRVRELRVGLPIPEECQLP